MKELILKYAEYNQWANATLINTILREAPQLLDKEIRSSFHTVRQTFLHLADAEYIWITRLTNAAPDKIPGKTGAGLEVVAEMDKQFIQFISSQPESFFSQETSYKNLKGESFRNNNLSILWHVFNHSTFHRGQVVTMLRNGGFSDALESTDLITYERLAQAT